MRNKEIEQALRRAVSQATPDVMDQIRAAREVQRRNLAMKTEQTVTMENTAQKKNRKWIGWTAAAAAVVMLAVGGGVLGYRYFNAVDSLIAIDVNPSIELKTSRNERVLEVQALNSDAELVLDGMELEGTQLKVAVNALIGSMVKNGYIDEAKNSVLVSVENSDAARGVALENQLTEEINTALLNNSISGAVLTQTVEESEALRAMANQYGISVGKAALIQQILKNDPTQSEATLVGLTINDLSLLALAKDPSVQQNLTGTVSEQNYIGVEKAKSLAQERLPGATLAEIEFDYENGRAVYEGEMYLDGVEYEFAIDATSGEFVKWRSEMSDGDDQPIPDNDQYIGYDKAKEIVLGRAANATLTEIKLDWENGQVVYEGEAYDGTAEYEFAIAALTGEVLKWKAELITQTGGTTPGTGNGTDTSTQDLISYDEAKQIVLGRAANATITELKLDRDDGTMIYEGEAVKDNERYEFEIDAATGNVREWKVRTISSTPVQDNGSYIGFDKAKEIVLSRVPGATITEMELDRDDGRMIYEGEAYKDGTEYEFTIDASTGDVYEWSSEGGSIDTGNNTGSGNTGSGNTSSGSTNTGSGGNTGSSTGYIGTDKARSLVEERLPGCTIRELELDRDDGRASYEGEAIQNGKKYEFEIDATTGNFIKWELDD